MILIASRPFRLSKTVVCIAGRGKGRVNLVASSGCMLSNRCKRRDEGAYICSKREGFIALFGATLTGRVRLVGVHRKRDGGRWRAVYSGEAN